MLNLELPDATDFHASVFTQAGEFVMSGNDQDCEQKAESIGGLYCWNINGRPVIRGDFEADLNVRTVEISYYNHSDKKNELIDPELVVATDSAVPTGRVLDGSEDHGYTEEWAEPAVLPDGRVCSRMYLFSADEIVNDGEPLEAEDYPWDDAHVARILLSE